MHLHLHAGIIRRLTNRKLGDLTGSDKHTEEESIRIYVSVLWSIVFRQTRRHFLTRISEHIGVSLLTGKKGASTLFPTSNIQAHTRRTNYAISPNDFSIISSCRPSSNSELLIRGSLLISKNKASLNENISYILLSLF